MKYFKNTSILFTFSFIMFSSHLVQAQCGAGETYNTYCYNQFETNTIAFEFCPTAGNIAQSTIIAGSVGSAFGPGVPNTLTVYEGTSGSGITGSIIFGPANTPNNTNFNGTVITASTTNNCLIFVFNSLPGLFGCNEGFDTALEVCSESLPGTTVTFTAPGDLCINAGVQTGLTGGSPTGGVYSGPGVTDDGNGMTYSFNPAAAGAAVHTLTYTNGNSATDNIQVFALPTVSFTALADHCIDSGIKSGLGGGSPSGGVYSGPGVTDNGNGSTYTFNPGVAGLGTHTITYTESSVCMASTSDQVIVLAACGCPAGQTSYFHCSTPAEDNLVIFEICPSPGMAAKATITQGTYTAIVGNNLKVYEGASGSSTAGTLLAGPLSGNLAGTVITGNGANNCLIFVNFIPSSNSCSTGFETALKVCGENTASSVTFTALADLCINEGIQSGLSGGLPTGGIYSGPGVTDGGNGMTYSFDPANAGVGVHALSYTVTGNSAMDNVEVFALGMAQCVSFIAPADLCLDAGIQNNIGGATPSGGVYSGPGVNDDGNGMTYDFDPAAAGVGLHSLTYTVGGNSAMDDVEVFALPTVTMNIPTNQDEFCIDAPIELIHFAGSPTSGGTGVYSGPGISSLGTVSFTFNPAAAGLGNHTITYTFTDNNGCINAASDHIDVMGTNYDLTGFQDVSFDFESPVFIISDQLIGSVNPNITVTYDAGVSITLDPNFEIRKGVIFHAFIDGCGGL